MSAAQGTAGTKGDRMTARLKINRTAFDAAKVAAEKLDAFLAASRGEESRCAVFTNPSVEEFTEEQRRAVRIYVESWIKEPLDAALAIMEGTADFETEAIARSHALDRRPFLNISRQS
jgi:hypothetical protein